MIILQIPAERLKAEGENENEGANRNEHPTTNVERGRVLVGSYCVSRRFAAVQHRGNRQTRSAWSASGLPALWIGPYRGARLRDGLHMESGAEARALHTLRASPGPLS